MKPPIPKYQLVVVHVACGGVRSITRLRSRLFGVNKFPSGFGVLNICMFSVARVCVARLVYGMMRVECGFDFLYCKHATRCHVSADVCS